MVSVSDLRVPSELTALKPERVWLSAWLLESASRLSASPSR